MSRPPRRLATAPIPRLSAPRTGRRLQPVPENSTSRRGSFSVKSQPKLTNPATKAQRTSKTSQKLVVLPSEPQKKPLGDDQEADVYPDIDHNRSEGERMTKDQRRKAGYKRLTAYCVADRIKTRLTATLLKREHAVAPRVFDEAIYVVYHLPLLPGYVPNVNVRSSAPAKPEEEAMLGSFTEAEENGYDDTYFNEAEAPSSFDTREDYLPSSPDTVQNNLPSNPENDRSPSAKRKRPMSGAYNIAEMVIFSYGVVVFFGLPVEQERAILEDLDGIGAFSRKLPETDWEIEECHFEHDAAASKPRIYNDFFTLKSQSHLLKLSISHALAQSTLLARYESLTSQSLTDPSTLLIPRQLAATGKIKLKRGDAMRLTGRLFGLRRDINLVSNVLDVPELFWSEASLKDLYDAVRDYLEISERVEALNVKLAVVKDLLDMIHEHLNGNAMVRITWIIIWLIVVACVVAFGEALARVVVHASRSSEVVGTALSPHEVLHVLDSIISGSSRAT